jgi:hypothetical protein
VKLLAMLVVFAALGVAGAAAPVRADPPTTEAPAKAISLAPHHTGQRVYGAPIQPPILHSRKRKPATHRGASSQSGSRSRAAAPQP